MIYRRRRAGPAAACSARAMSAMLRGGPRADVERARDGLVGGQREHVRPRDVADVDEVAQLPAVLEDLRRAAAPRCAERKIAATPA